MESFQFSVRHYKRGDKYIQSCFLFYSSRKFTYEIGLYDHGHYFYYLNGNRVTQFPPGRIANKIVERFKQLKPLMEKYISENSNELWWEIKERAEKVA